MCPDTLFALNRLSEAGADIDFKDILSCHADLKVYLALRDTSELYSQIKGSRSLGIPCFILENGKSTLDINDVIK